MGVVGMGIFQVCEWSNHSDECGRGDIGKQSGVRAVDYDGVVAREVGDVCVSSDVVNGENE
jgi:hypothetical protein